MTSQELYEQFLGFNQKAAATTNPEEQIRFRACAANMYNNYLKSREKSFDKLMAKTKAKVEEVDGQTWESWLAWAESLYPITKIGYDYELRSNARELKKPYLKVFPTNMDAVEKRIQLVGYKITDRKRGRGDIDKDLKVA